MSLRGGTLALLLLATAVPAFADYECAAAKDLVVRSIEGLHGGAAKVDLDAGLTKLGNAEGICPNLGDLWYYKALFLQQLMAQTNGTSPAGMKQKRAYQRQIDDALKSARLYHSEAMEEQLSPFVLATPKDSPQAPGPVRQKWALIVGIGKFSGKFPQLSYTGKDAQDVAAALSDPKIGRFEKDHVQLLTDGAATLVAIRAALNRIARQADPADLVFVFIASHGTSRLKDAVGGLSYIVTYDTTDPNNQDQLYASSLAMVDLSQIVRSRIRARRAVIVLDTCFSGGAGAQVLSPSAPSAADMEVLKAGVGRAIISSSSEKQQSEESDQFENGVFTHYFLEGLRKNEGKSSLDAIFNYVSQAVPQWSRSNNRPMQTPAIFKTDSGEAIVLGAETQQQVATAQVAERKLSRR
jgi:hypothetical protein